MLLEVREVTKSFPGVLALRGVDLTLGRGEVLAVLGENGAGKSTLMKILAGVQAADEGTFFLEGKTVRIDSVRAAMAVGIALIHQELNLAENLEIAANIFLGRELRRFGLLDDETMREEAAKYLAMVGLEVDPAMEVGMLPIGKQQLVEIAKALSVDAQVLIMDEPTSSLSQTEAEQLFVVIKDLVSRGVSIIYISHRLSEIGQIADRVMVLRDGENAGELMGAEINHQAMVQLMVGRDLDRFYQRSQHALGEVRMEVHGLRTAAYPDHETSFQLAAGEVVGVAGLVGAGRSEILEALFGVVPALGGEVWINGQLVRISSPQEAIAAGLALVPEDRKTQGAILDISILENISLASLRRDARGGAFLNLEAENELAQEGIKNLSISTPGVEQYVRYLSGGNQQKVVLAKWLVMKPQVLLLDEPTRGIDVGAKEEIYGLIEALAQQGMAILFVSSELEEVMGLSDRVLVMHEGAFSGELGGDECTEERIMSLATGDATILETTKA
ncbi:sugar ABC transporter ATP-binding protein [Akkermansiaceae bacterium]|nr:sugar ABC transporter ATP-binding protein [Akkermansiaceae bacterium]MDB4460977.1 sugar ABC transporter ATP-binding protein [bacterium]